MASDKVDSMSEKLNKTKQRLTELSQKVAESTKTMINNTNESIKSSVAKHKEKREQKAQEKISNTKVAIGQDGLMDDIPPMITLPEFEDERLEIAAEQNENMISIVEEMQRLSERMDSIERRFRNLSRNEPEQIKNLAETEEVSEDNKNNSGTNLKDIKRMGYKPFIVGFIAMLTVGIISISTIEIYLKYFI